MRLSKTIIKTIADFEHNCNRKALDTMLKSVGFVTTAEKTAALMTVMQYTKDDVLMAYATNIDEDSEDEVYTATVVVFFRDNWSTELDCAPSLRRIAAIYGWRVAYNVWCDRGWLDKDSVAAYLGKYKKRKDRPRLRVTTDVLKLKEFDEPDEVVKDFIRDNMHIAVK